VGLYRFRGFFSVAVSHKAVIGGKVDRSTRGGVSCL